MWMKYSSGGRTVYQFSKFIVDEESELSQIKNPGFGDEVYVISTGESWVLGSTGNWHIKGGGKDPIACDCVEESTIWQDLIIEE